MTSNEIQPGFTNWRKEIVAFLIRDGCRSGLIRVLERIGPRRNIHYSLRLYLNGHPFNPPSCLILHSPSNPPSLVDPDWRRDSFPKIHLLRIFRKIVKKILHMKEVGSPRPSKAEKA